MFKTVMALRTEVLGFVKGFDPSTMSGEAAATVVRELAVVEKAAATGRMFAAVRVAQTDAWRGQGHGSAADWLAAQCGISVAKAQAQLRTAKAAQKLPRTKKAMASGKLSPDQADAVTGAAAVDPDAEDRLLDSSQNDTNRELRRKADEARAAATDTKEREARVRRERSVRYRTDADGAFCLSLRGPAADGARIVAMLRPYQEAAFRHARPPVAGQPRDTFDNRTYDAFTAMLAHHAHLAAAAAGAPTVAAAPVADAAAEGRDDGPAGASASAPAPLAGRPPGAPGQPGSPEPPGSARSDGLLPDGWPALAGLRPPGGNNTKVIIRVDHRSLLRGHTVAGETCDIDGVGPIPVAAVRALLLRDDPFVAVVLAEGGEVQRVAHLGRGLNAKQRTAIEANGIRCSNIACNRTVAIQIDHRTPWATDPVTQLDNQDPLCPECHRRKTHHGWRLAPGTGPRRFVPPGDVSDPRPDEALGLGKAGAASALVDGLGEPDPAERQLTLC